MNTFFGTILDPVNRRVLRGALHVDNGRIASIETERDLDPATPPGKLEPPFLLPGFVDAHVHVESSMLTPAAFAKAALRQGTLAAVADPHEIANVLGIAGPRAMMDLAEGVPFVFGFGASPCVPSTPFETTGGALGPNEVAALLADPRVTHLSEVMNVPGVLNGDPALFAKIDAARRAGKPIDGHAPLLSGAGLRRYAAAGITTDHECETEADAREKLAAGILVQLREGSAARNLDALLPVLRTDASRCLFCADDKHPDDLLRGHINRMAAKALRAGVPLLDVLLAACVNAVRHYRLPLGLLQSGDSADFLIVESLDDFAPRAVFLHGEERLETYVPAPLPPPPTAWPNNFHALPVAPGDFTFRAASLPVIGVTDGILGTERLPETATAPYAPGAPASGRDPAVCKLVVLNRYEAGAAPAVALARGIGVLRGAIATSVAHDAHDIIAAGSSDAATAAALNAVIATKGGLAVADANGHILASLPLPFGGLMGGGTAEEMAAGYARCQEAAHTIGTALAAPFMTLSFLSLAVIPHLRLTDKGLFDVDKFAFV